MQLTLDKPLGNYQIRSYQMGNIQVNDQHFHHSIIVSPYQLINDWPPQTLIEMTAEHVEIILNLNPDVVLLGSGTTFSFPDTNVLAGFYQQQIGIEVMDTGSACRTYNVLAAEGRQVVAALLVK